MIRFACRCGEPMEAPNSAIGEALQCPTCHRLVDVPSPADAATIEADGTVRVADSAVQPEQDVLERRRRYFSRDRVGDDGEAIDLHPTVEDILNAGTVEPAPDESSAAAFDHPKYDPLSGELIRPLELTPEPAPPIVPMATPVIGYATPSPDRGAAPGRVVTRLLRLPNLFVMVVIAGLHLILQLSLAVTMAGLTLSAIFLFFLALALVAHYANVIEEMGPGDQDELPRPLGDFSFSDDIWRPFSRTFLAMTLCLLPALLALWHIPGPAWALLAGLGLIALPAVLLTTLTSGSWPNLRPDRALGPLRHGGMAYVLATLCLPAGAAGTMAGFAWVHNGVVLSDGAIAGVGAAMQAFGIFALHYAAMLLADLYRRKQASFGWVYQHHISTRRDTMKQLERMRQAGALPARPAPPGQ